MFLNYYLDFFESAREFLYCKYNSRQQVADMGISPGTLC
jgi:hypothetical protein